MAEKKSSVTGQSAQTARQMLEDPLWRQRPRDARDSLSVRVEIDDENVGFVTLGAGWIKKRGEYGWTRIKELRLRPMTGDGFIDGSDDADLEPIIERAAAHARRELHVHELTRRFINDLLDEYLDSHLLDLLDDPDDKPRDSEIREMVANIYSAVIENGRRDPIQWIAAVLGVSERTAHRRLDEAERAGLVDRNASTKGRKG